MEMLLPIFYCKLKISGTELEGATLSGEGSNPGVRQGSDARVVASQMERSKCTTDRAPEYKVVELDWLRERERVQGIVRDLPWVCSICAEVDHSTIMEEDLFWRHIFCLFFNHSKFEIHL